MSTTQVDTIERTDTTAADQAWWAMDVPCKYDTCSTPAAWHARKPCGHSSVWCDEHRRWNLNGMARALIVFCYECDHHFDHVEITWTRL